MNHAETRRNHWVSHIARQAHAKPGAVHLRFEGASTLEMMEAERVASVFLAPTLSGEDALRKIP